MLQLLSPINWKMKKYYLLIFTLLSFNLYSQAIIENGNIKLEFKKAKTISKLLQNHTLIIVKSKELKTIMIKIKMESLTDNREIIDVNKFFLIDEKSKSRIKLIDASRKELTAYVAFEKLVDENIQSKKKKSFHYSYDSTVKDKFYDYKMESYKDIVCPINFGSKRKPNNKVIYYRPDDFRRKKLILFFPFLKNSKSATLYYGDKKIKNFSI